MKEAIVEGDADKFEAVIGSIEKATVMLSGPGGSVAEALRIGAFIRSHSFATMVLPDQQCYSACALIWISAFRRYLAKTSLIGFHAAWILEERKEIRNRNGKNAQIGSILDRLGSLGSRRSDLSPKRRPTAFHSQSPEIARGLGIEVFEQSGANITTPAAKPTVDTLATLTALFAGMANNCASLFEIPASDLKAATGDAVKQGNAVAGAETFVRLMLKNIDEVKTEISSNGPIKRCRDCLGSPPKDRSLRFAQAAEFRLHQG